MLGSLSPRPAFLDSTSLVQSFTQPCPCFLQPHRDLGGCPLPRAAGQALTFCCWHTCKCAHKKPGPLQNTRILQALFFVAFHCLHARRKPGGTSYQLSCRLLSKIQDLPIAAVPLPHKSFYKFSKHGSRLPYCFLNPALQKGEYRYYVF